MAGTAAM